jgi:RNA polymerase sigma-70 factor, ECF subfamily
MANLSVPIAEYFYGANIVSSNYMDPVWIEELYTAHRQLIYHVALRITRNTADAEEVVQNVFLRMMRNDRQPDVGRCAVAYFRRAAMNTAIDLIRKRAHRSETNLESWYPAPQQTFVEEQHVRQALGKLTPKDASLCELHYRDGYLYHELAEHFGIPIGTVKSRLHRIRGELENELQAA